MEFEKNIPEWKNEGVEPADELKTDGFTGGYHPPAGIFNWFWNKVTLCINELQQKLKGHAENKENPHSVTAAQVGLGKVNNTADSEKNVAFASEAAASRKVKYPFILRFKGGSTEGTDLFTYDGSTSRSANITPAKIGAAEVDLSNVDNAVLKDKVKSVVTATRITDTTNPNGQTICNYIASVDGVTKLYNGLEITIIPDVSSNFNANSDAPDTQTLNHITLNVNGLGTVPVRQPLSFSTYVATTPEKNSFLAANTPCRLMYHENYASGGIWLMAEKQKTSAQDLYGTVPIESGGTGVSNINDLASLLALNACVVGTYKGDYGTSSTRIIPLEFTPKAVFVCRCDGMTVDHYFKTGDGADEEHVEFLGGLAVGEYCLNTHSNTLTTEWQDGKSFLQCVENGFKVSYNTDGFRQICTNHDGYSYFYIAFR